MPEWSFYVFFAVIVAVFIALIFSQTRRRRAAQAEYTGMLDTLRMGMRVKTVGGVLGKIREIREEAPGFKTVLLETGDPKNPSLVLYDLQAIYGIVDDEAILAKRAAEQQQAEAVQNHESTNQRVHPSQNVFEAKKAKKKSN